MTERALESQHSRSSQPKRDWQWKFINLMSKNAPQTASNIDSSSDHSSSYKLLGNSEDLFCWCSLFQIIIFFLDTRSYKISNLEIMVKI